MSYSSDMLRLLRWFFRIGGLRLERTKYDKYFTAMSSFFILISTTLTIYFWFQIPHDPISSFFVLISSVLFYTSGFIAVFFNKDSLKALIYLTDIENDTSSNTMFEVLVLSFFVGYDLSRVALYVKRLYQNLFLAILGGIGINFINAPLIQQLLMVHQLTNKFSTLNNELRKIKGTLSSHLDIVFKEHTQLRSQLILLSSHYSLYNFLSFVSRLIHAIMSIYVTLASFSNNSSQVSVAFLAALTFIVTSIFFPCEVCFRCVREVRLHSIL